MKKLHSLALCALVTPVITFGAGSVLAQHPTDKDMDRKSQSMQHDKDARQSGAVSTQDAKSKQGYDRSDSKTVADRQSNRDQSRMQNRGYMGSTPDKGMHASNLIGTSVKTTDDEEVGSINDLIIDKDGQVVAIVVGVGGILGMGEKNVAIGWDDVKRSGEYGKSGAEMDADDSDDLELRIKATREDLRSAPEYEEQD